ncbi:glycosyltransferase family 4 protein [Cellulomonas dongxiuzhuiae]|uniref:glycosyltransferase family 4 protein n=1 Tax=Cellulomonas dongxiuzhuiae TaxID=2819979 RepID=UPI001AAEEF96|nr:glycosyltransferase family 4 protein [Cellulomonas dongxiuzhuiae]MBO3088805.1 glycosyltransferase family 4 protein [Cellulomonas dongxiuzhuiae]
MGRIVPGKRIELAIEALARVPDVHLAIIGEVFACSEEYEAELRKLARDLGVGPRVHFLGYMDAEDIYRRIDILLVTNPQEASGRTVGEAMVRGLPAIVPTNGGAREFFKHATGNPGGVTWDVLAGVPSIAAEISRLASSPALRLQIGARGAQIIHNERNPLEIARTYLNALQ